MLEVEKNMLFGTFDIEKNILFTRSDIEIIMIFGIECIKDVGRIGTLKLNRYI